MAKLPPKCKLRKHKWGKWRPAFRFGSQQTRIRQCKVCLAWEAQERQFDGERQVWR